MGSQPLRSTKYHLNRVHTLVEMLLRRTEPTNVPLYCWHEPTTGCNLQCPACPTGLDLTEIKETASVEDYERVCGEFGGYLDIYYLFNWGEPTMAKTFAAIARRLSSEPFQVKVSTNFSVPLKDEVISALADMPNLNLRISVDGATQDSHAAYRVNSKLSTVLNNAERLSKAIKTSATPPLRVCIGFLPFAHNKGEDIAVAKMAADLGFEFQRYDTALVADEPMPEGDLKLQQAFGCTWLYSSICPTPKLTHLAPCCGVWNKAMLSQPPAERSLHDSFMHDVRYKERRTTDADFSLLPTGEREAHLKANLSAEEGMALHQKGLKVDACVGCTMGAGYQNKLNVLVQGAVNSMAVLKAIDADLAQKQLFALLQQLVPGQEGDPALRARLVDALSMPPVMERRIGHYDAFARLLAASN